MKKLTLEAVEAKAKKNGIDFENGNDMVAEAVRYVDVARHIHSDKTIEQIIIDGAKGKETFGIYDSKDEALNYFEAHKFEINEILDDLDIDVATIGGYDRKDRLCLTDENRVFMAKWTFEYAIAIVADWFELEYLD